MAAGHSFCHSGNPTSCPFFTLPLYTLPPLVSHAYTLTSPSIHLLRFVFQNKTIIHPCLFSFQLSMMSIWSLKSHLLRPVPDPFLGSSNIFVLSLSHNFPTFHHLPNTIFILWLDLPPFLLNLPPAWAPPHFCQVPIPLQGKIQFFMMEVGEGGSVSMTLYWGIHCQ